VTTAVLSTFLPAGCTSTLDARAPSVALAAIAPMARANQLRERAGSAEDTARLELLQAAIAAASEAVAAAPGEIRARLLLQDLELELDPRGTRERYASGPAAGAMGKTLAARALLPDRLIEARSLLEQALREDEDFAFAHYGLAFIDHRDGLTDRAREGCERALRLDPGLIEALRLLAQLCDGSDRARAIAARQLLVRISGGDLAERHALAQLLLEADDRSDANDAADELKAIIAAIGEPADAEARGLARDCWLDLGTSFARRNKPDQAIDCWKRALALDGECLPALFNIGLVEQGRGNPAAALEAFETYLARAATLKRALPAEQVLDRHFYVPNRVRALREQLVKEVAPDEAGRP
jgi:tetratricopeptide (TPR) repeat protein